MGVEGRNRDMGRLEEVVLQAMEESGTSSGEPPR